MAEKLAEEAVHSKSVEHERLSLGRSRIKATLISMNGVLDSATLQRDEAFYSSHVARILNVRTALMSE